MAQVVVLVLVTNAVRGWPGGNLLAVALHILVATLLWHQLQYLLLSRRVPRAALVPGAVVAGIGQVLASLYSALYVPRLMAVNAARYGVIGVTFALLAWFIVIAFGMVLVAVLSAELGRRRLGEARPSLPDEAARATSAPPWDVRA
jgi:membrane protein